MMRIPNRTQETKLNCKIDAPWIFRGWHLFSLWHLLSLDAPTVALAWLLGFAWAARITLPVWIPVVLVSGTWGVYLLDRILDARTALNSNQASKLRRRHIVHWRLRFFLFPLGVGLILFAIVLAIVEMPNAARLRNGALVAAALGYFCAVHARVAGVATAKFAGLKNFKELFVAVIFTAACVQPVLARVENTAALFWPAIIFIGLAWLNCHAIEVWESRASGVGKSMYVAAVLLLLAILIAQITQPMNTRIASVEIAAAVSVLLMTLLQIFSRRFSPLALRVAADLTLLTPVPLLIWSVWP